MHVQEEDTSVPPTEVNAIDGRISTIEGNVHSINRLNRVENSEESGVYFADGLRKIDLVLAYEGNSTKVDY